MRDLTIKKLHEILGGRLRMGRLAPRDGEATPVRQVVIDSRRVEKDSVFWGLPGSRADGATFADEAYSRGASGVVAGARYVQPWPGCWSLEVPDGLRALEQLARWNRHRFAGRMVAVTGSVGKTTTRHMIHAVLADRLQGITSPYNFNNHVGLPLSMLGLEPEHDFAVLELAASAAGEIGGLATLCQPHVGVITRVGDAHLGGFGSLQAIAEAKAELLAAIPADGWAVLDGDDERLRKAAARCQTRCVWFGRSADNDVVATHVESRPGRLLFRIGATEMSVAAWGRHHLASALAAVAVGRLFGLADRDIAGGLAKFSPPPMRCQVSRLGDATIINDSYNASPTSMRAALELLRDVEAPGRRIVVCGDMRELGEAAPALHRKLGDQVVTLCGADLLVACGEHALDVVAGARAAGMPQSRALAYRGPEELLATWSDALRPGDVVLVKGSRALAMERLVDLLQLRESACAA